MSAAIHTTWLLKLAFQLNFCRRFGRRHTVRTVVQAVQACAEINSTCRLAGFNWPCATVTRLLLSVVFLNLSSLSLSLSLLLLLLSCCGASLRSICANYVWMYTHTHAAICPMYVLILRRALAAALHSLSPLRHSRSVWLSQQSFALDFEQFSMRINQCVYVCVLFI